MIERHSPDLEDLAAGYALGALEPDDRERFARHLEDCPRCVALVAEHASTVSLLPLALDEMPASPDLKARLMQQVRQEPRRATEATPSVRPIGEQRPRPSRRLPWVLGLAASLLLVLGLGAWNLQLQRDLHVARGIEANQARIIAALAAGGQAWRMEPGSEAPGAGGVVVRDPSTGELLVHADGLAALPPDRTYQAWVFEGSDPAPKPAGLSGAGSSGSFILPVRPSADRIAAVALSLEPAGGSPSPTGPVVLLAKLTAG
jgi:anti-sigma-K factor RskA